MIYTMYPEWIKRQAAHFLNLVSKKQHSYEKCLLFIELLERVYSLVILLPPELSALVCKSFVGTCNKISLWYEGMYESESDIFNVIFTSPLFNEDLRLKILEYPNTQYVFDVYKALTVIN